MPDDHRYDDIINQLRHVSLKRPRMPRQKRAAQFSPFSALAGFSSTISEASNGGTIRVEPSDDARIILDRKLTILKAFISDRPPVTIVFFAPIPNTQGGEYVSIKGVVRKIQVLERKLIMEDGTVIDFNDLLDIDGRIFD